MSHNRLYNLAIHILVNHLRSNGMTNAMQLEVPDTIAFGKAFPLLGDAVWFIGSAIWQVDHITSACAVLIECFYILVSCFFEDLDKGIRQRNFSFATFGLRILFIYLTIGRD